MERLLGSFFSGNEKECVITESFQWSLEIFIVDDFPEKKVVWVGDVVVTSYVRFKSVFGVCVVVWMVSDGVPITEMLCVAGIVMSLLLKFLTKKYMCCPIKYDFTILFQIVRNLSQNIK